MTNKTTKELTQYSLFAALIFLSVQSLRIPVGPQFVHLGNALVVIGLLLYGSKVGALVASIGLGVFDLLNGYASVAWITILESLVVCLVLHLVYEKALKADDKTQNIIIVAVVAAITKIILNFIKYTITNIVVGNLTFGVAASTAIVKIGGTFGTALVTIIAVPILYPIFKQIVGLIK